MKVELTLKKPVSLEKLLRKSSTLFACVCDMLHQKKVTE